MPPADPARSLAPSRGHGRGLCAIRAEPWRSDVVVYEHQFVPVRFPLCERETGRAAFLALRQSSGWSEPARRMAAALVGAPGPLISATARPIRYSNEVPREG